MISIFNKNLSPVGCLCRLLISGKLIFSFEKSAKKSVDFEFAVISESCMKHVGVIHTREGHGPDLSDARQVNLAAED